MTRPWAIAGATGYIGTRLASALVDRDVPVRGLARRPERTALPEQVQLVKADVLDEDTLGPALEGCPVAFYLVHSMGRGGGGGYAERDRTAAANFARAAADAGVERIVYLGGLARGGSEHLESREETGRILAKGEVPVTWLRAAAVLGAGSESFRACYYLVRRLPVMVTPTWTKTPTQPIGVADVVSYLADSPAIEAAAGREIEIGGADVTTYGGMFDACARAMGRRPPVRIGVPLLTPALSSKWIGLVTPVDTGVAKPLIHGLSTPTIVTDRSGMALYDVEPAGLEEAMAGAVREIESGEGARGSGETPGRP